MEQTYEIDEKLKIGRKEDESEKKQLHFIEDATCHYIIKKILEKDSERGKSSCLSKINFILELEK